MDNICKLKSSALVLQGGGALGAYQGGVYEALAATNHVPDWVAGISIGAINAALIAGNAPEQRVERLRAFWDLASSRVTVPSLFPTGLPLWFAMESPRLRCLRKLILQVCQIPDALGTTS